MENLLFPELNSKPVENDAESTQKKSASSNLLFPELAAPTEEVPEWGRKNPNIWAGIQAVKETGKQVGQQVMAVPETALSLLTGMTAYPIGAVGELGALVISDAETAKEFRKYLGETYTYQPKGEAAKQATQAAGEVLSIPFKPAEKYKEIVTEKYGPWWGELAGLGAEALTMGLMSYAHSSAIKLMPEKLPLPSKEIKAFDWEKYSAELREKIEKTEDPVQKIETVRKFVDDLNESFGIGQGVKPAKESAGRIEEGIKKEVFKESVEKLTEVSGKSAEDSAMEFRKSLGLEPEPAREIPVTIRQKVEPEFIKSESEIPVVSVETRSIPVEMQSETRPINLGSDVPMAGEIPDIQMSRREMLDFLKDKEKIEPSDVVVSNEEIKAYIDQKYGEDAKVGVKQSELFPESLKETIPQLPAYITGGKTANKVPTTNFLTWIKDQGGIWDKSLPGETKQYSSKESGIVGLVKKNGLAFDEMAARAKEAGWDVTDGESLRNLLDREIQAATKDKTLSRAKPKGMETEPTPKEAGEPTTTEITAGNLKKGDKVTINGEDYTHKGYDKKTGDVILKDHETIKIDSFERLEVEDIKPKGKRDIKDIIKDLNTAMGETGSIGGNLTPEQQAAKQRLSQDLDYLKSQAKQSGKSLYDYLILEGIQPDVAKTLAGEMPKYAGSINLERQNIPDNYKAFELELSQSRPKRTQSWDETGKLSADILADAQQSAKVLEKAKKGQALTPEEIDAARQINVNAIDRLKEIAQSGNEEQFTQSFTNYKNDIFAAVSDASSVAGKSLNIHKKEVSVNRIAKSFNELERNLNERELKEFKNLNFENPLEIQRFIDRLGDPKLMDYIYEYWYNSILSGIPTHAVNAISNTLWGNFQLPRRALTAGIDGLISKLSGKQRDYFFRELLPMMAGEVKGFLKGGSGAWEMIKTGEARGYESKWNREMGEATASAFERSPYKILRDAAPYITVPTRALRAMDIWANSMAFDAQLGALAKRRSLQQFPKDPIKARALEKQLLENPTKEMLDNGVEYAKYTTFNDDPGAFANWIMSGRDIVPGGRFILPFVRTIGNIFKRGMEMTPGVGAIVARKQPLPEILAKQVEGSILTLYALYKADQGEITGPAPIEPAAREAFYRQGKIPWGIKIGGNWYQYRRFEPFNTTIASTAIAYDAIKNAKDDKTATDIFFKTANGIANNLIDSSYLDGISKILDKRGNRSQIIPQQLASLVPMSGFWRSINRAVETLTEGDGTAKARSVKGISRSFAQVIPGLSSQIPAKINVWGEEISLPGGVLRQWLPYKYSEATQDPVELELEKLKVYPGLPKQEVTIRNEKVKLPDELYKSYALSLGQRMKDRLDEVVITKEFQSLPDARKIRYIDRQLSKIRQRELHRAKVEYAKSKSQSTDIPIEEE